MKKLFGKLKRGASPSRGPGASPKLSPKNRGAEASAGEHVIGYDILKVKDLPKLHKAAWNGDIVKVNNLVKKDPSAQDKEYRTPLHLACARGHTDVVVSLLEWKAKTNVGDSQAKTPLLKAVECKQENCVRLLLEAKADVDATDSEGNSGLHYAVRYGYHSVVILLLRGKAQLNIKNNDGCAPLHIAAIEKREQIMKTLLDADCDVNIRDENNRTPLMHACEMGCISQVKMLIQRGADSSLKDERGWTADDYAMMKAHHGCSHLVFDNNTKAPKDGSNAASLQTTPRSTDSPIGPAVDIGSEESDEEDISRSQGKGNDSWGEETDISLAQDLKKKDTAKVSLAKYINTADSSEHAEDSQSLGADAHSHETERNKPQKRDSTKSETSIDDSWSVDSDSPDGKKSTSSLRVSFKPDKELSEIHDITADEESESDIEAKKPRLSPKNELEDPSMNINYGAGMSFPAKQNMTPEKHKAIMSELGLSDVDDITDPDFSMSEVSVPELPKDNPTTTPFQDEKMSPSKQGILRNTMKEDTDIVHPQTNIEDEAEWDPETEDALRPEEFTVDHQLQTPSKVNMRSSLPVKYSPKDTKSPFSSSYPVQMGRSVLSVGMSDTDEDDFDINLDTIPKPSHPPSLELKPPQTPSHESPSVPKEEEEQVFTDDESSWDSEVSEKTGEHNGETDKPSVVMNGEVEDEDSEPEIEESISEWEIERQKQKEEKQDQVRKEQEAQNNYEDELRQQKIENERQAQVEKEEDMQRTRRLQEETRQQFEERERERIVETESKKVLESRRNLMEQQEREEMLRREEMQRHADNADSLQQQMLMEQRREEERLQAEAIDRRIMWEAEENRRMKAMLIEAENLKREEDILTDEEDIVTDDDDESFEENGLDIEKSLRPLSDSEVNQSPRTGQMKSVDHLLSVGDFLKKTSEKVDETTVQETILDDSLYDHMTEENAAEQEVPFEVVNKVVESSIFLAQPSVNHRNGLNVNEDGSEKSDLPPPPLPQQPPPPIDPPIVAAKTEKQHTSSRLSEPAMFQSDGLEDDDSSELDSPRQTRHDMTSFLPHLYGPPGLEDDGLSITSTENEDNSAYMSTNRPYSKDILMNLNLTDPSAVIKVQDHLRENRKQLDQERGHMTILENKHKSLAKEKNELQKKIDAVSLQRSKLEQMKLDLQAKIRTLEYSLSEEVEKRKNAEILLSKSKEQLSRKEDQYTSAIEAKQRAELSLRNLQLELRTAGAALKELEEEKNELLKQIQVEKECRQKQEQITEEQHRLYEQLQRETIRSTSDKNDAEAQLEVLDETKRQASDNAEKLRAENYAVKMELDKQRTRLKDEIALLSTEKEELLIKMDEMRNDIKLNEEALAQASMQFNLKLSAKQSEFSLLSSTLEKEYANREKLETELGSLGSRMTGAVLEIEKLQQTRNELERLLQQEKEQFLVQMDRKEEEIATVKENNQELFQKLNTSDSKVTSLENELHLSNTTLLEKNNKLQKTLQEMQFYRSAHENTDQNIKLEKEQNAKLQSKLDALQEKISMVQHENLNLRQQLDTAQSALSDKSGQDMQERITTMLTSLKAESEKSRVMLEEKNLSSNETISRLREEISGSESRRVSLEQDLRRLNQDHTDLIRKLSVAEATLEIGNRTKDQLETEKAHIKIELQNLQQRYQAANEKAIESTVRIAELTERLDKAEQSNLLNSQQLANTSTNLQMFSKTKEELEDSVQKLQVENVKLDAELKHEKQRSDTLHRDLQDSQKVRSSLEALCSNLKSTTAHLEDKLEEEQQTRKIHAEQAEENKDLWEKEVLSRSKLGMRIAQMEKHKQNETGFLEKERREALKAIEAKREAEIKLESEREKSSQLQKEVTSLKVHLKSAKKRLKAVDSNESRLGDLNSDFDRERVAMEDALSTVRLQLEDLREQLTNETEEKSKLRSRNSQLQSELSSLKKLEKSVKKLEHSKSKLEEDYKMYKHRMDSGQMGLDQARKELEANFRLDLNRKLDEVNAYLEEQARARDRLDRSRDDIEKTLKTAKRKLEEENGELRIKYEQALAQKETRELEAKRYRDLYESEMQWRQRISEQLQSSTNKTFNYKSKILSDRQRGGHMFNFSGSGATVLNNKISEIDPLADKIKMELERSIAKHMEAAPHDTFKPVMRTTEDMDSSLNKSSNDYIEVLRRKYCI
ncbi:hypothetical protein ScPMuIL_007537 [Solemya velum]